MTKRETLRTTWDVWTYDVWGNARDGYDVNDRHNVGRDVELIVPVETHNVGTPHEFKSAAPTDAQIREALGIRPRVKIETDGDDVSIYVRRARDGYPLGELICTSHESLSPPRPVGKVTPC